MYIALVDWDKCTGCEECVRACPVQVFQMTDGKSEAIHAAECINCGTCLEVCPDDAILISIGWGG